MVDWSVVLRQGPYKWKINKLRMENSLECSPFPVFAPCVRFEFMNFADRLFSFPQVIFFITLMETVE